MSENTAYENLVNKVIELEKREQFLKEEIAWRRILIEQSRDGIVILDQNGKVFEANKKYADMLGYLLSEVFSLYVWDWDIFFNKEMLSDMINQVNQSGDQFETKHKRKDGSIIDVEISTNAAYHNGQKLIFCVCRDVTNKKREAREKEELINNLQNAVAEIKKLKEILPFCSYCKKIRDDKGYWEQVDVYMKNNFDAEISHSICPSCMKKHYPKEYKIIHNTNTL